MRLVAENGDQLGIKTVLEALKLAEESNVDLVEIAPLAVPPVCKLMDYGKFRYREQKKEHEAKRKQKQIQVKEIKFRPGTDEGDYKIKLAKRRGSGRHAHRSTARAPAVGNAPRGVAAKAENR